MPTPKELTKKQLEEIKSKQRMLKYHGYNVEVNGKWDLTQENLYKKIGTHDKLYSTDPLGFINYLVDKFSGNTTYYKDPMDHGLIRQDSRSNTEKFIDSQLSDNKTPIGYIYRTILPSAAVAAALVGGTGVLGRMAPNGIKALSSTTGQVISKAPISTSTTYMVRGLPTSTGLQYGRVAAPALENVSLLTILIPLLGTLAAGSRAADVLSHRTTPIPITTPRVSSSYYNASTDTIASDSPSAPNVVDKDSISNTSTNPSSSNNDTNNKDNKNSNKDSNEDKPFKKTLQEVKDYWVDKGNKTLKWTLTKGIPVAVVTTGAGVGAYKALKKDKSETLKLIDIYKDSTNLLNAQVDYQKRLYEARLELNNLINTQNSFKSKNNNPNLTSNSDSLLNIYTNLGF